MTNEISLEEFLEDIRKQKERRKGKRKKRKPAKEPKKKNWEKHSDALSKNEYDELTRFGRQRLRRPRPVWLEEKNRWTVGAPANPTEWQILIRSEPMSKDVTRKDVEMVIMRICGSFRINDYTFSSCVSNLQDRRLLKIKGGFRRSKIADGWLFPNLTGLRAGGEWHRKAIHNFIDMASREFGCYTYADRGYYPGVEMPDVIVIKPQLVEHTVDYQTCREPLKWNLENPVYAEFKSSVDMRKHPSRLKEQLEQYGGVPLYLAVQSKIDEAGKLLEEHGRREVNLLELLIEAEDDMVYLCGGEYPETEKLFEPVLRKVREALRETYDWKARLRKTGTDPQGREYHDLILYDKLGTAKNCGQVIPNFGVDVKEFVEFYFDKKYLGRITTPNYIYEPERKPTPENKTWKWRKKKTAGFKFRSFSTTL